MARRLLDDAEARAGLAQLEGWYVEEGRLLTHYRLSAFKVVPFYTAVAAAEDQLGRRAAVRIADDRIEVAVGAGGAASITDLDLDLAAYIARLATAHAR